MHGSANDVLCTLFSESGRTPFRRLALKIKNLQKLSILHREFGALVDMKKQKGERYAGYHYCAAGHLRLLFCAGNSALWRIWKKEKGERYMQDIIIALLALYAVWSARKIMRLSAVLHILVRMLGEMLEEEPQDLTNSADRLY